MHQGARIVALKNRGAEGAKAVGCGDGVFGEGSMAHSSPPPLPDYDPVTITC